MADAAKANASRRWGGIYLSEGKSILIRMSPDRARTFSSVGELVFACWANEQSAVVKAAGDLVGSLVISSKRSSGQSDAARDRSA